MTHKLDNQTATLAVAYMASTMNLKQQDIAERLGMSQSAVSRLLEKAKKPYLIEQSPYRLNERNVDKRILSEVQRIVSVGQLAPLLEKFASDNNHLRGPVLQVIQVPSEKDDDDQTRRFTTFASLAAPLVRDLLMRESVKSCGVTWGFMLNDLCSGLRKMGLPSPWRRKPIRFVPLTGDPLQDPDDFPPSLTSSSIAAEMSRIVNGEAERLLWLGLVPAYIPNHFKGEQLKGIERLIRMGPEYVEIFGGGNRRGLAHNLSAIVTSVGRPERPLGFGFGRLFKSLGPRLKQVSAEIYGDIGGVLLPRTPEKSALISSIELRWKGMKREHLELCAKRAFQQDPDEGRPGVIVLANGKDRAEVLLHAIEQGLINHLIIDQHLEKTLESLLSSTQPA